MNITQRPSLKFSEGLPIATKKLDGDATSYVCTNAQSIKSSSGGGWTFAFQSRTLPCKWVKVDKSGRVTEGVEAGSDGRFKAPPRFPIEKAVEIALATRDKPRQWHAILVRWDEQDDEWFLVLVNSHRDTHDVVVDSKGKAREVKP